ncbi:MAG TPA: cupredoxin domain-containing protein [Egibacteraceae bacterium]|nr:cupredoxin domain-containing protein [Egibacteraceae bacterium]
MRNTLHTAAEGPRSAIDVPAQGGFGWRRLQLFAAVGALASFLVPMLLEGRVEPFLLSMAAPFAVGIPVLLRWPRVGAVWLGVVSVATLLSSAPFLADALTHPESLTDFIPLVVLVLSLLVGTIAAIPSFRAGAAVDAASRPARTIAIGAGALAAAAALLSVAAFTALDNAPAQPGDIRVVTEHLEFLPSQVNADGGTISVHVSNNDSTRHTFTIDELAVDLNVPPGTTQRVTFSAEPGTYRFYCRPHAPGMQGELAIR